MDEGLRMSKWCDQCGSLLYIYGDTSGEIPPGMTPPFFSLCPICSWEFTTYETYPTRIEVIEEGEWPPLDNGTEEQDGEVGTLITKYWWAIAIGTVGMILLVKRRK